MSRLEPLHEGPTSETCPACNAEPAELVPDLATLAPGVPHDHREYVAGCARCYLSRFEVTP